MRGMQRGRNDGSGRVEMRREVRQVQKKARRKKKTKKAGEKGKSAEKGKKAGRGPPPTLCPTYYQLWEIAPEGGGGRGIKGKMKNTAVARAHVLAHADTTRSPARSAHERALRHVIRIQGCILIMHV